MKTWKKVVTQCVCLAQLGACASSPDRVDAKYVSPTTYQSWNCAQLLDEKNRLDSEVKRVTGLQQENADADAALMGVGLILFWPALFGLAATKDRKEELGKLKGEYEAVTQQMRSQNCPLPAPGTIEAETTAPAAPAAAPGATPAEEANAKEG